LQLFPSNKRENNIGGFSKARRRPFSAAICRLIPRADKLFNFSADNRHPTSDNLSVSQKSKKVRIQVKRFNKRIKSSD
jgi:hypothetical protein